MGTNHAPQPSHQRCQRLQNTLAEIQALGQKLGIQGTPALIFESGKLVAGAIPAEDIEKLLNQKK